MFCCLEGKVHSENYHFVIFFQSADRTAADSTLKKRVRTLQSVPGKDSLCLRC